MLLEILALHELNKPVEIPQPIPETTTQVETKPKPKPKPKTHKVVKGDSLVKIGTKHKVKWQRLWAKNKQLKHPDLIHVGDKITIPAPTEKLKRSLPAVVSLPTETPGVKNTEKQNARTSFSGSTGLNGYTPGQCTAWVAGKRYVPPGWGDASNWRSAALAAGWRVSSRPVAGAIGWTPGHVVYVESVNGSSVTISEQNYDWNSGIRTATFPASKYQYLY